MFSQIQRKDWFDSQCAAAVYRNVCLSVIYVCRLHQMLYITIDCLWFLLDIFLLLFFKSSKIVQQIALNNIYFLLVNTPNLLFLLTVQTFYQNKLISNYMKSVFKSSLSIIYILDINLTKFGEWIYLDRMI